MAQPVLPFGVPVNGFHPQMTAVPNLLGPLVSLPPPPSSSSRRRRSGAIRQASPSNSWSSSSSARSTLSSPQVSLSSAIDAHTQRVVNSLREDVLDEERQRRRMVRKRNGASSSSGDDSSSSFSESDTSSRSGASFCSGSYSSRSTGRSNVKRQRRSYRSAPSDAPLATVKYTPLSATEPTQLKAFPTETTVDPYDSASPLSSSGSDTEHVLSDGSTSAASSRHGRGSDYGNGFSDLYSEVFLESDRPQLIATLGGRIVAWNDQFLTATGLIRSQLRGCVTVHNLVDRAAQSRLNDLFELALREGGKGAAELAEGGGGGGGAGDGPFCRGRPPLMVIADAAGEGGAASDGRRRRLGGLGGTRELRQIPATAPVGANAAPTPASVTGSFSSPDHFGGSSAGRALGNDVAANAASIAGVGSAAVAATGGSSSSDSSEDDEEEGETHLSMMLPCRTFRFPTERLCITIILMNDIDPSKRCFYCILSPQPTPPPQSIAFTAHSVPGIPTVAGVGGEGSGYKPIGNGWYRTLHSPPHVGTGSATVLPQLATLMQQPALTMAAPPSLGKIRRIGQKQLASLL